MFGMDWFLGLIPTWVPWLIIATGILLFVLIQFFQYLIPIVYRVIAVIVIELLALILFAGGFYLDGRQAVLINAKAEIDKVISDQKDISDKVIANLQKDLDVEKSKHDKLIKLVPKYITKEDDSKCVVPQSFVRLHNYSAKDTIPESTTTVDGIASRLDFFTGK